MVEFFYKKIIVLFGFILLMGTGVAYAADHNDRVDNKLLIHDRRDSQISDLFTFVDGDKLILILATDQRSEVDRFQEDLNNPKYRYPSDTVFEINIDRDSVVEPEGNVRENPVVSTFVRDDGTEDLIYLGTLGGVVKNPDQIREDIVVKIKIDEDGFPQVKIDNEGKKKLKTIGLEDPFGAELLYSGICGDAFSSHFDPDPNIPIDVDSWGRINRATFVVSLPLKEVLGIDEEGLEADEKPPVLLLWATSKVEGFDGPFQEYFGRGHYSEGLNITPFGLPFDHTAAGTKMNKLHPRKHMKKLGIPPSVLIYDTTKEAKWPNGRKPGDDIPDLWFDPFFAANVCPGAGIPDEQCDAAVNLDEVFASNQTFQPGNASVCPYTQAPYANPTCFPNRPGPPTDIEDCEQP